jgi:hypothetical protein
LWISSCAFNANEKVKMSKIRGTDNMHRVSLNGQVLGEVRLGRNGDFSAITNKRNSWIIVFDGAREGADSYPRVLIFKIVDSKLKPAEQFNFLNDLRIQDEKSMTEMQFLHFNDDGNPVVYSTHGKEVTITG